MAEGAKYTTFWEYVLKNTIFDINTFGKVAKKMVKIGVPNSGRGGVSEIGTMSLIFHFFVEGTPNLKLKIRVELIIHWLYNVHNILSLNIGPDKGLKSFHFPPLSKSHLPLWLETVFIHKSVVPSFDWGMLVKVKDWFPLKLIITWHA